MSRVRPRAPVRDLAPVRREEHLDQAGLSVDAFAALDRVHRELVVQDHDAYFAHLEPQRVLHVLEEVWPCHVRLHSAELLDVAQTVLLAAHNQLVRHDGCLGS